MKNKSITLPELDLLKENEFVSALGEIFEHSAWVAEAILSERPFQNFDQLLNSMVMVVNESSDDQKMHLLRSHPQLAGKEAQQGELTDSSTQEQLSAGLSALRSEEMTEVAQLNQDYLNRFGFPFIIAVKNYSKDRIFSEWRKRLKNSHKVEFSICLNQVYAIAENRLALLVTSEEKY